MSTEPDFEKPRQPAPESSITVRGVLWGISLAGLLLAGFISLGVGADAPFSGMSAVYMIAAVLALGWAATLLKPGK